MIVTLTPNPGFDRTMRLERLDVGEVNRAIESSVEAGGKGINVSRALAAAGIASTAIFPADGADEEQLRSLLSDFDGAMAIDVVTIREAVRSNLSVITGDGETTKFNEGGPALSEDEAQALIDASVAAATQLPSDGWFVACGSVPKGCGDDFHARTIAAVRAAGVRVGLDASGRSLATAIDAAPDLIKPNVEELAELVDSSLATMGDVIDAARSVIDRGVGQVLVSLGSDGAVLVSADDATHTWSDPVTVRNTVGAGDAMLAGFLATGGIGAESVRSAVAWGAAAVQSPTTAFTPPPNNGGAELHTAQPDRIMTLGDS